MITNIAMQLEVDVHMFFIKKEVGLQGDLLWWAQITPVRN